MKKIKLLTSLVGLTGLSMGLVPMISGCSCHNKITPELSSSSSPGVKIKESNIVKGQESTITLTIPQGKEIDTLTITIGNKQLKQGTDFTVSNNKITIKAEAVTGENVTVKVIVKDKVTAKKFAEAELSEIIAAIQTFEDSDQDETAMQALCANFSDTEYIPVIDESITDPNRRIEAHLGNFIGKTTTIKINNQPHTIRVIGINHDKVANTGPITIYAAFTFELVTLLSGSDGNAIQSKWDTTNNNDYIGSTLSHNLCGRDDQASWGDGTVGDKRTALQMLPAELRETGVIQKVEKKVATKPESSFEIATYSTTIFPLTYTEMAQPEYEYAKVEGTAYKYWELNESKSTEQEKQQGRKKKDAAGNNCDYWLCSPDTNYIYDAWGVDNDGVIDFIDDVRNPHGVSFGFCI